MNEKHVGRVVGSVVGSLLRRGAPGDREDLQQEGWATALQLAHVDERGLRTAVTRGLHRYIAESLAAPTITAYAARDVARFVQRCPFEELDAMDCHDTPESLLLQAEALARAQKAARVVLDEMDATYGAMTRRYLGIGCEAESREAVAAAHGVPVRVVSDAANRFKTRARAHLLECN